MLKLNTKAKHILFLLSHSSTNLGNLSHNFPGLKCFVLIISLSYSFCDCICTIRNMNTMYSELTFLKGPDWLPLAKNLITSWVVMIMSLLRCGRKVELGRISQSIIKVKSRTKRVCSLHGQVLWKVSHDESEQFYSASK